MSEESNEELPPEPGAPVAKKRPGRKSALDRLKPFRAEMGKVPDEDIAAKAGVTRGVVGMHRRRLGIEPYAGYLFRPGHRPMGGRKPGKPKAAAAPSPKAIKGAPERRRRKSVIDDFAAFVGVQSDAEVAKMAGVTRAAVGAWRKKVGIAASRDAWGRPTESAVVAGAPAPAPVAAAPVARPARPAPAAITVQAFLVVGRSGATEREFYVVATDIVAAAERARNGLSSRGQWSVDSIKRVGDAL